MNTELFADWLFTVTENDPEVAPDGISTSRMLTLQPTTVALVPLRDTVLVPCVVPKPDPVICTTVPTGPLVGEIPVMVGAWACAGPAHKHMAENASVRTVFLVFGYINEYLPTITTRTKERNPAARTHDCRRQFY